MIAALLLALGTAGGPDRLVTANLRGNVVTADGALGVRAGLRIGPVELYGGIDPFVAVAVFDDQVTSHTLALAAGVRGYFLQAGPVELFGALDGLAWNETIHDSYDELYRYAFALVGVRSRPTPFFYDVALGPGVRIRRTPAFAEKETRFAWTVQAALGVSF